MRKAFIYGIVLYIREPKAQSKTLRANKLLEPLSAKWQDTRFTHTISSPPISQCQTH